MSGLFNRIAKMVTFGSKKRLVGRDLEGNKYFELPAVNGGNVKRVVEYRVNRDIADYTTGTQRLPVQWTTWLSHTRSEPPSMAELQADSDRRSRLQPMIAAIEERERLERIRQGYISAPADEGEGVLDQIAGPSSSSSSSSGFGSNPKHSGMRYGYGQGGKQIELAPGQSKLNAAPSFVPRGAAGQGRAQSPKQQGVVVHDQNYPDDPSSPVSSTSAPVGAQMPSGSTRSTQHPRDGLDTRNPSYPVPTPETPGVAPPSPTVDPSAHDSPEQLRKLSEEDTKRRILESERKAPVGQAGSPVQGTQGVEGVQGADVGGSGFKPRRRRG